MTFAASERRKPVAISWDEFAVIAAEFENPLPALTEMVRHIANRFEVDVCSLYLLEADGKHIILAATMGLRQSSVGRVRMPLSEGLAGLVAEELQPVAEAEAAKHPRFKYFPEAGEEFYSSFLGLPLIVAGALQGVLVVQTITAREFSDEEFGCLARAARLLGPRVRVFRSAALDDLSLLHAANPKR
ncbi:MAG: GAF domain-containing protein [Planctomycetales bacterium]|nr:GAF domain-containing protein [Planctomycetales bacterium]